jgi:hypothetical protein
MDSNMFPKPYIAQELAKFVRAKLYTDRDTLPYETYREMQQKRYNTVMLPLYVILEPDGETLVARFKDGYTKDSVEFKQFLLKGTSESVSMNAGDTTAANK